MSDEAILRFAQGIKAREEDSATAANENFYATRDIAPDQAGEANILARATTLPPDVVQRNLPAVREGALAMLNRTFVSGNPKLAVWASNPAYASVAKDDIASLDRVSRTSDYMTAAVAPKPTVWNYIKGVMANVQAGYSGSVAAEQGKFEDLWDRTIGNLEWHRDPESGQFHWVAAPPPEKTEGQIEYERIKSRAADATPDFKSWYGRSLYSATANLAQMVPQVALAALTRSPVAAITLGSTMTDAQGYGDLRAAGARPGTAAAASGVMGLIEAATEFVPSKMITRGRAPA